MEMKHTRSRTERKISTPFSALPLPPPPPPRVDGRGIPPRGSDGLPIKLLRCGHVFDETCWRCWVRSGNGDPCRCPVCRRDVGAPLGDDRFKGGGGGGGGTATTTTVTVTTTTTTAASPPLRRTTVPSPYPRSPPTPVVATPTRSVANYGATMSASRGTEGDGSGSAVNPWSSPGGGETLGTEEEEEDDEYEYEYDDALDFM